jgi:hypothetical protein
VIAATGRQDGVNARQERIKAPSAQLRTGLSKPHSDVVPVTESGDLS